MIDGERTVADQVCAVIAMRLTEDVGTHLQTASGVSADAEVNAHVGSCLRCFRTAMELRETPRIAALLREEAPADPGEFFWAELSEEIGKEWERHHKVRPPSRAMMTDGVTDGTWQRASAWIRRPIPAALMGAAAAAMLTLAAVRRPLRGPVASVVAPRAAVDSANEDTLIPAALDDVEPWDGLDVADLKSVMAQLVPNGSGNGVTGSSDEEPDVSSSPTEEIELLEGDELTAVATALGGRSRI